MSNELGVKLWNQLTLLPEDSHVRTYQSQGRRPESRKEPAVDFGLSSTESFANFDPDTSSWRTSQASLLTGWEEFLATWPKSGTMQSGRCYRRQMSAHPTSESGSSLLPTPQSRDWKDVGSLEKLATLKSDQNTLPREVAKRIVFPTPTTMQSSFYAESNAHKRHSPSLASVVKMWPTPNASDHRDRGNMSDPSIQRRIRIAKQISLSCAVKPEKATGTLNPTWVEWLMGFPFQFTEINDEKEHAEKAKPESKSDTPKVRKLRGNEKPPTPSPELREGVDSGSMSDLPHQGRPGSGNTPKEEYEALQSVRGDVSAVPQQETQHLQSGVPVGDRQDKCDEEMGWWEQEPDIPRVASGVKNRVDRLKGLGNAVVPQCAEWIGRQIIAKCG